MRTANTETRQQVETLLAKDAYAGALGITVIDAAPGAVRVGMTVRADNLNFLDWGTRRGDLCAGRHCVWPGVQFPRHGVRRD